MAITPEGVSVAVILVLHVALLLWAAKKIFSSALSGFEKASWFLLCLALPLVGVGIYATYEKKYLLRREFWHIMIAVALLGFLFSFRLWGVGTFSVGTGINNWLRMCGLALVALGVHIIAQKATAKRYRAMSHFGIWPLGIAISIIIIFVTNGWFVWAAVGVATVGTARLLRPGRRIEEEGLTLYEIALVMAAGTFANIGLAVLGKLLIPSLGKLAHQFMIMNLWIAVFSVVPLFLGRMMLSVGTSRFFSMFSRKRRPALEKYSYPNKPYLRGPTPMVLPLTLRRIGEQWRSEGEIMLFGSRPLWIFTFVFAVVTAVMILSFSAWLSVLSALALATVLFVIWTHKMEPMRWMRG